MNSITTNELCSNNPFIMASAAVHGLSNRDVWPKVLQYRELLFDLQVHTRNTGSGYIELATNTADH